MPQHLESPGPGSRSRRGDRPHSRPTPCRSVWLGVAAVIFGLASSAPISAQTRGSLQARARVVAAGPSASALEAGRRLATIEAPRTMVAGLARIGPLPDLPGPVERRRIIRIDFLRN